MRKTTAHFWNLNEDPQLSNMIHHFVKPGKYNKVYWKFAYQNKMNCQTSSKKMEIVSCLFDVNIKIAAFILLNHQQVLACESIKSCRISLITEILIYHEWFLKSINGKR